MFCLQNKKDCNGKQEIAPKSVLCNGKQSIAPVIIIEF
jgi:hypothetical protein